MIEGPKGQPTLGLDRIDWADLDHNGDVLCAIEGRLYRCPVQSLADREDGPRLTLVADLNELTFEAVAAPDWARRWP
jgi:hypothetical protein